MANKLMRLILSFRKLAMTLSNSFESDRNKMPNNTPDGTEDQNVEYQVGGFTIGPYRQALHAFMQGAQLQGALLYYANLAHSLLAHANLEGANLESANLVFVSFENAKMANTDLKYANLTNTVFSNYRIPQ